ncbi:3-oxo-5-alpha-steroid 4-dehydrogenase-domain-containing protein [Dunaliella salina]|uniref:3-oxo-5-alpha-steroid 4-dehydrogenase-domain-containing protein n=1 Tax=Dunaliella salina TaxID=3046 RepID=A0ABQ7G636_DUNSA|nr:3-oxo-5-alpha-steroid 4-dehydrogenase-domain-containing protein [Dunaliella salina]|eukprot:KAF5830072.1 3-oxo-5-alpha-steroid 4-dehydrogenase-domain-containing protein [Dunaliella salina]
MSFLLLFFRFLPVLLTAYWVLATSAVIVTLLPLPLPQAFKDAVRLSAARGKLWSTRPKSLGRLNDLAVPQAWFSHFYAIGTACCLLLLLLATPLPTPTSSDTQQPTAAPLFPSRAEAVQYISLWMFLLHLLRRLLETCCLMVYPPTARMHVIAYVFGLSYYMVAPFSLLNTLSGLPLIGIGAHKQPGFTGMSQGSELLEGGTDRFLASLLPRAAAAPVALASAWAQGSTWQVALGMGVTFIGFALQFHSHRTLAALAAKGISKLQQSRKVALDEDSQGSKGHRVDASTYSIPHGGAFEWVSCPHYAGEIIIYAGLLLLTWPHSPNAPLMLGWVLTNLVLAAGATQHWYHAAFPHSFPKSRKALVPFIF